MRTFFLHKDDFLLPHRAVWLKQGAEAPSGGAERFNFDELSDLGKITYENFVRDMDEITDRFFTDMDSTDSDRGMMSKAMIMGKKHMELAQNETNRQFVRLVDQIARQFYRVLWAKDRVYREQLAQAKTREERKALDEQYGKNVEDLRFFCQGKVDDLHEDIKDMSRIAGGADEFINESAEIMEWSRNFLVQIERLQIDENFVEEAMKTGFDHGLSLEYMEESHNNAMTILRKIADGEELIEDDYYFVEDMIAPYLETTLNDDRDQFRDTVTSLNNSGALVILHAMTPAQRFTLGEHLVGDFSKDPWERRHSVKFLTSMGYLEVAQAQRLVANLDWEDPERFKFDENELDDLLKSQELVEEFKKAAIKVMEKNPEENFVNHWATASNLLIYEVIGRVAVVGMILSLAMNPKDIPGTLTDPVFLAMGAVAGISIEHMTSGGDLGRGAISRGVATLKTADTETHDERFERHTKERLQRVAGRKPETMEALMANKGELLGAILNVSEAQDNPEDYQFQFADLDEHWQEEYAEGLDEMSALMTERQIAEVFTMLRRDLALSETDEMLTTLEEIHEELGFTL